MKSPLIIGTDVRTLHPASMAILQNSRLIDVNQDELAVQGTLRAAFDESGNRAPTIKVPPVTCVTEPTPCPQLSPWMTHCTFGSSATPAQQWAIQRSGHQGFQLLVQTSTNLCLARSLDGPGVHIVSCDRSSASQAWDLGAANLTVAQVRDAANVGSCLTFNSSSLHMAPCLREAGDKKTPNPTGCTDGNCRFSGIIYQVIHAASNDHVVACGIVCGGLRMVRCAVVVLELAWAV